MNSILLKIKDLFSFKGADRTEKAKKNIVLLFIINGFNFLSMMLIVPLTLKYLGPVEYGIWITLHSVLVWVGYLDLGIGNGLRIKLSESFARDDVEAGKTFTSTAYAVFGAGMVILFIIFFIVNIFLDWTKILNTPPGLHNELNNLVILALALFLVQFVLRLITYILNADQRVSVNGAIGLIVNFLTITFLYVLNRVSKGSLINVAAGSLLAPIIVFAIVSIILFKTLYKKIRPSFSSINLTHSRDLTVLGGQFFIIQAAGLIVFATDSMIITQLFGPAQVTIYNIAYRYFNLTLLFFNIILNPVLSAYTEAYTKNEFDWIKKATGKILKIWMLVSIAVIIMILISDKVYKVWVGNEVSIPFGLSVAMGVFVIITSWCNIFAYIQNGVGKIRVQFYNAIVIAVINIPLSVFLAGYLKLGPQGVIIATSICMALGAVLGPIQYGKILNNRAYGIWGK